MRPIPIIPTAFLLFLSCIHFSPKKESIQYIRDSDGRIVIYHGVNISNYQKNSMDYMPWQSKEELKRLNDWGFNLARFLIFWEALEPNKGVYNDAYMKRVVGRIKYLQQIGVDVVVDFHQDLYSKKFGGDGFPSWSVNSCGAVFNKREPWHMNYLEQAVINSFQYFWGSKELQRSYIDAVKYVLGYVDTLKNVVGIDIINEPYSGMLLNFERDYLSSFYTDVRDMMSSNGYKTKMFFEPRIETSTGLPTHLRFKPVNAVYSPHYYDPLRSLNTAYTEINSQILRASILNKVSEAQQFKCPLIFGEFGMSSKVDGYLSYITDFLDITDEYCAGWAYWSYDYVAYNDNYGLIENGGEETPVVEKLVRVYPQRIAGKDPLYRIRDNVFSLSYKPLNLKAPTVIFIPERLDSVQISVNGQPKFWWRGSNWSRLTGIRTIFEHVNEGDSTQTITITWKDHAYAKKESGEKTGEKG